MRCILLSLFSFLLFNGLFAQDFLTVPSYNPKQFRSTDFSAKGEKIEVIEQNFIYLYDTLELPFIDDFSRDHFPKRVTDTASDRLTDTTLYGLFVNGVIYNGAFGFSNDSTYTYPVGSTGQILDTVLNDRTAIRYADLTSFPVTYKDTFGFPPFNINDTLNAGSDTLFENEDFQQDTVTIYTVAPDSNDFYTDRSVYLNNTFAIAPPSIGVVTFDGLDEFGLAYDIENPFRISADKMTSVPINLSGLPDTNVYFSFEYEPKGLSIDEVDREDSLALDFFNVDGKFWSNVWRSPGFKSDTFQQAIIKVPNNFHKNGFQFRFRNYASSGGAFDQWHLDYLYLNNGRSINDTVFKDITYIYDAPPLLKDYYAMPYFHFKNDPSRYTSDTARTVMVNSSDELLSVYNKVVIPDTTAVTDFYQFPTDNSLFNFVPSQFEVNFEYPIDFDFPSDKVDSAGVFTSIFDIDFRPTPSQEPDFIRTNDTVFSKTVLKNYYAYDDGTAEAGYGVNPQNNTSFMAVEFNIPFRDTLEGLQLYFLPQALEDGITQDVRKLKFVVTVWNSLDPGGIIYEKTVSNRPVYSDDNEFVNYSFDSAVVVNQTFYIGIKSTGLNTMSLGYDLNTNNRTTINWSQDGVTWNNPSTGIQDGSLMLRPFFRDFFIPVGLNESDAKQFQNVKLYPNPVDNRLRIEVERPDLINQLLIHDIRGRTVMMQGFQNNIDVSSLENGIYLMRIEGKDGSQKTEKFIVSHK